mmetsp:Transcript_21631/g.49554  ORF Transcript_21631/g.49554 Transcript_21631/m.49554 type:complete len:670 (-) Transcript_21631:115-2124(-)
MIRITSIALTAAIYGYSADAAGCHPAFNGGTTYKSGDTVSATSTVETTTSCMCSDASCPNPNSQTTGCEVTTTTTEKHNYSCVEGPNSAFCSMSGFEPAGQYSSQAWTKESAVCSGVATITAAPILAAWQTDSGCPDAYVSGKAYGPDDTVSVGGPPVAVAAGGGPPVSVSLSTYCSYSSPGVMHNCPSIFPAQFTEAYTCDDGYHICCIASSPGSMVSNTGGETCTKDVAAMTSVVYECAATPNNLFCGMSGYEPGTGQYWENVWTLLGSCSGTISPTTSPAYTTLTDQNGCPDAWEAGVNKYKESDKVAKGGLVYQCNAFPYSGFCGQTGYEPNADDGTEFWKQAWTVIGYCSGTISPTQSPAFDSANSVGGCPDEWVSGVNTSYEEGDTVSITVSTTPERKIAYTCKAWPFSGFCGMFAPNSGLPDDQQGWTMIGNCDGTISPTQAPAFTSLPLVAGGCPTDYDENNLDGIEAGDQVSLLVSATTGDERRVVYECKAGAVAAYCTQKAFVPGGDFSSMAWTLKGYCDGTISPTQAPTAYTNTGGQTAPATCEVEAAAVTTINKCFYEKDVKTTGVSCTCSDSDCPNPNGQTTGCTKTTVETSCPSVDAYSSSATYEAGDVVRIGNARFKCKAWPHYLWCSNSAYEPTTDPTDIWTDAWSTDGTCPP